MDNSNPARLIGWLFADIMAVLAIVGLAAGSSGGTPATTTTTSTTVAASDTSTTSTTSTTLSSEPAVAPCGGLELPSLIFNLGVPTDPAERVDPARRQQAADSFSQALASNDAADRQVGFVLAFGAAGTPNEGVEDSRWVNDVLSDAGLAPLVELNRSLMRDYYTGGPRGTVELEVFLVQDCQ